MNTELNELKLPMGPRGRALQSAREAIQALGKPEGDARDAAFADFTPPRRTDSHHAVPPSNLNTGDTVQVISAQLRQLDEQRAELSRLLATLGADESR